MDFMRILLARCAALFRRPHLDAALDEELRAHIDLATAENIRNGQRPTLARTNALRAFGGLTQTREAYRTQRGMPLLEVLAQDLHYALRQLRKSPAFTLTAIITLALGIGANTAIFTLVRGILLRSLPVADPSHLYRVGDLNDCCYYTGFENDNGDFDLFPYDLFLHLKSSSPEFEQLAAVQSGGSSFSVRRGSAPAKPMRSEYVSGNYFATLGISTYAGRPLLDSDDRLGATPVLVLSYQSWQSEFAEDTAIIGSTVYVQTQPFIVVGIAPPGFFGNRIIVRPPDFWVPLSNEPTIEGAGTSLQPQGDEDTAWLYLLGRVRPNIDIPTLQSKLSVILRQWMARQPSFNVRGRVSEIPKQHVIVVPGGEGIQRLQQQTGTGLRMLMILSSVVLLIACANIANLMLVRSTAQRTDMALRMALGAARTRLMRQILTQSVLLSLIGGAAGLAIAYALSRMILSLAFPASHNMPLQASPSLPVLGFAFLVSLLTGIVFGIAPALAIF